jgi:hypothetical protein
MATTEFSSVHEATAARMNVNVIRRLHHDEAGDTSWATVLLIAFIVVPLVTFLILKKDETIERATNQLDIVLGKQSNIGKQQNGWLNF